MICPQTPLHPDLDAIALLGSTSAKRGKIELIVHLAKEQLCPPLSVIAQSLLSHPWDPVASIYPTYFGISFCLPVSATDGFITPSSDFSECLSKLETVPLLLFHTCKIEKS